MPTDKQTMNQTGLLGKLSPDDDTIEAVVRLPRSAIVAREPESRWMQRAASPLPRKVIVRAVRERKITAAKVGKTVLLDRAEHDAFIAEHTVRVAQAQPPNADEDLAAAFGVVRKAAGGSR